MPEKKRTRPAINASAELHVQVETVLKALGAESDEFHGGGGVYDLGERLSVFDGSDFHSLDADSLRTVISERVRLYRKDENGQERTIEPKLALARSVISERRKVRKLAIPRIEYMLHAPYFTEDGEFVTQSGYHEDSETFLTLDRRMHAVFSKFDPDKVTERSALRAVAAIQDVFADFPFKSDADRAHLLTLILEQPMRPAISGPTPLYAVVAPVPGTGKSLLLDSATGLVGGPNAKSVKGEPGSQDEYRKTIMSGLQEQKPFMVFDNVIRCVSSPAISHWATQYPHYTDRILSKTVDSSVLNTATKIISGNNVRFNADNARRSVPIMLDAGMEDPASRTEFKHSPLLPYVQANRPKLLRAVMTVVAWWVKEDMPLGGAHLGSFEAWSGVMSGVLDSVGVPGFLDNLKSWRNESDDDRDEIDQFIDLWAGYVTGGMESANGVVPKAVMSAGELYQMIEHEGIFYFDGKSPESSMGRILKLRLANRPVGEWIIKNDGQRRWRLMNRENPAWPD